MFTETEEVDPSFLNFLALKKGAKFDDAKYAWDEIRRYREVQAAAVAKRLLGNRPTRKQCYYCKGSKTFNCGVCFGDGWVLND